MFKKRLWCDEVDPTLQNKAMWLLNKNIFILYFFSEIFLFYLLNQDFTE